MVDSKTEISTTHVGGEGGVDRKQTQTDTCGRGGEKTRTKTIAVGAMLLCFREDQEQYPTNTMGFLWGMNKTLFPKQNGLSLGGLIKPWMEKED